MNYNFEKRNKLELFFKKIKNNKNENQFRK